MIADIIESCKDCKLLDKTKYETNHGFCEFKQTKRRYSNWPCRAYEVRTGLGVEGNDNTISIGDIK